MKKLVIILFIAMLLLNGSIFTENLFAEGRGKNLKNDELILAIASEPEKGFDPTTGWGRYGSPLFQSTLLKRDRNFKIVNDLATSHEIRENGLVWLVKLRQDVKFSDGEPLTASDVVYTFETAAKSGSVVDLTNLKSVEALDIYKVRFTLRQPQITFINKLIQLGIVPKHAHDQSYSQKPVGSGPFKFLQWDKGQQLIVESNPYYYGAKPFFKKLTFLFLSEEASFAAAKAGAIDIACIIPALGKQNISGMKLIAVPSVDNRGIMFPMVPSGNETMDGLPVGNDVTADIAIRKAINVAIDRKALVNGVLNGFGSPAYSVCDHLPWWNPDTVITDADLKQARKILADYNWKDNDNDGILEKGNLKARFTLVYPAGDQTRQSLAISVADMVKPSGIRIDIEGKSWDEIKRLMHSNAILFGWGSHEPLEMYSLYYSKNSGVEYFNAGFYSNSEVDRYMNSALSAVNEQKANEYWKKAQWDGKTGFSAKGDAPWAWLVNLNHLYLVRNELEIGKPKIEPHGHGWPITDNIAEWRWKNK